ncbi:MAG: hypothetical protein HYU80_03115 [Candidatus Blackburnbacteria bacterium]|nr:hypothetical protein [Candidatus Blackburnbacteria bacterium]
MKRKYSLKLYFPAERQQNLTQNKEARQTKMKYYELDKEEQEFLEEFERGEWKPTENQAQE